MTDQDIAALRADLVARRVTALQLQQAATQRATEHAELGAFITLHPEHSAAVAQRAQDSIDSASAGPLCGVPVAYKDNYCTAGIATTAGSRLLEDYLPPYESHVTTLLNTAGAVSIGKCNMDEFAMGTTGENSAYGATRNPWHAGHCAGGSSSGSAAAVAARIVPVAIGSDTGGSVRMPAAYCGISGIKPTYGLVSRRGIVAYASSLDQAGVLATSAADLRATLEVIAAHDPHESTSLADAALAPASDAGHAVAGTRIGIAEEFFAAGIDTHVTTAVKEAIDELGRLGAKIVPVSIPHLHKAIAAYYIIACAEASSNLARYDGLLYGQRAAQASLDEMVKRTRSNGFGAEVQKRIMLGSFVLSHGYVDAYYRQAQRVRQLLMMDFDAAFEHCDALAMPATPTTAPKLGAFADDPLQMYAQDICTCTANLCGLPALVMPCGAHAGLPIGAQLVGPARSESLLLALAERYQQATDFHTLRPPGATAA